MSKRRVHQWDEKPGKPKPKKKATKAKPKEVDEFDIDEFDIDGGVDFASKLKASTEPEDETERVAQRLGIDISTQCPVCRTLESCSCTEEDRSFQRRIRFEHDVEATALCQRCGGALTCVLIPRAGTNPPFDLSHMAPVWGCAHCHGASLATVLVNATRGK